MDKVGHVAAAPGLLASPSRVARPPSLSYPQRSAQKVSEPILSPNIKANFVEN